MEYQYLAIAVWWSIAVLILSHLVHEFSSDGYVDFFVLVALAVIWPLFVPFAAGYLLVMWTYEVFVKSGSRIRQDLRNRQLLAEFDAWNSGRILPKKE